MTNIKILQQFVELINSMTIDYTKKKICPFSKPSCKDDEKLPFFNEIQDIMTKSRSEKELSYYWHVWHEFDSRSFDNFLRYLKVMNKIAKYLNFENAAKWQESLYEHPNIMIFADKLWKEIVPLYEQLYTYMKARFLKMYPSKKIYICKCLSV